MAEISREKQIVRTGAVGIAANVLLAGFKAAVGAVSGSIAIVLDAVNNLSDALSSVLTIVGTKLSGRRPDKKHPYGYGRIEYLTATIIALIVLVAGSTSFYESVKAIIKGSDTSYALPAFIIMAVAILAKLALGRYTKKMGEKTNSGALVASGADATFDAIVTATTLVSALIFIIWGVNLDGWLGAAISLVIIKSGIEMVRDALADILGHRADHELAIRLKKEICSYDGVLGAYDLVLNNYGPSNYIGSVNIGLRENLNTRDIYVLTRKIQLDILAKEHVYLVFGVYAISDDPETKKVHASVMKAFADEKDVLQVHGFYVDRETKVVNFDVVINFGAGDFATFQKYLQDKAAAAVPGYTFIINIDLDVSD